MKRFKRLLATLLAATMVLGSTMTVLAAPEVPSDDTQSKPPADSSYDINVAYDRDKVAEEGKDDTKKDIYNVQIKADNLNFSFEAMKIEWNATDNRYDVTLDKTAGTASIQVKNLSNKAVKMTPSLSVKGIEGITCTTTLTSDGKALTLEKANGEANLQVDITNVAVNSEVTTFGKIKFGEVNLHFDKVDSGNSEGSGTQPGPDHTGGASNL